MLRKGIKYSVKLNGMNHILEVDENGKYITVYGFMFPEKTILIPNTLNVRGGDILGVRTTSEGIIKLHTNHEEAFKPGNAYSFSIGGIQEVKNEG